MSQSYINNLKANLKARDIEVLKLTESIEYLTYQLNELSNSHNELIIKYKKLANELLKENAKEKDKEKEIEKIDNLNKDIKKLKVRNSYLESKCYTYEIKNNELEYRNYELVCVISNLDSNGNKIKSKEINNNK